MDFSKVKEQFTVNPDTEPESITGRTEALLKSKMKPHSLGARVAKLILTSRPTLRDFEILLFKLPKVLLLA